MDLNLNERGIIMSETTINELEVNGVVYVKKGSDTTQHATYKDYCIVRTFSAGVFAGNIDKTTSKVGTVRNARRIWYWRGAASLNQLAMEGVKKPKECKFAIEVPEVHLTEIIEIIPCTKAAFDNIKAVPEWRA